jgi:hypothetical protein
MPWRHGVDLRTTIAVRRSKSCCPAWANAATCVTSPRNSNRCTRATTRSPGELLLDLAADAIDIACAGRESPVEFEGIRERHLPEAVAHSKAQHHKSKFGLRAAAMIHGGVNPGLLDEVQWWRTDDLWFWSLEALAVYVLAAAERTDQSVASVARQIGSQRGAVLVDDAAP